MTAVSESKADDLRDAGPTVHFDQLMQQPPREACAHFRIMMDLKEQGPVHFGDASGNPFWVLTGADDQRAAYQNSRVFSSSAVVPDSPNPPYFWIPEMLDAPLHNKWRKLLGPLFSPGTVEAMEGKIRERFTTVMDEVAGRGRCEFNQDVALKLPNQVFMDLMGLPVEDADQFQVWETQILHQGSSASESGMQAAMAVHAYFDKLINERRSAPKDDILSKALSWEIDGAPILHDDLLAFCLLMFMAGLDTVATQLCYTMFHLANHPEDRARLVADPSLIPTAMEEFLRYYSFVTPGRKVLEDTEIAGQQLKAGEMVFLPLVTANRDAREFAEPDKVIIDRRENRHVAFGSGPHRCLGAHLARLELNVALELWLQRVPDFRIDTSTPVREHGGQIGLVNLPLEWDLA
ncbi:cytochrome P450 [Jatrophihabitans fulvus]